jgi:hypothetical protein
MGEEVHRYGFGHSAQERAGEPENTPVAAGRTQV